MRKYHMQQVITSQTGHWAVTISPTHLLTIASIYENIKQYQKSCGNIIPRSEKAQRKNSSRLRELENSLGTETPRAKIPAEPLQMGFPYNIHVIKMKFTF